ncbi:HAMP domain-containing sensor histidine kinase [Calderihabitans maritimus]|uniref:histidine kinase n=1 Tax=Calderihabitans maritimus TaxID=1246530 RepID=A0A1Z5HQL2_9FIRM|nr:HAMP domain-containing sensor histidine kinase [Calderihabitans maritimus]GAW91601.1 integral membrane sensor signal transduction histidine kinase [Calderihabitans maritimus]
MVKIVPRKRYVFLIGVVLVALGFYIPKLLVPLALSIVDLIEKSIKRVDTGLLILAAAKLVIYQSVKGLPGYLGVFLIAESIETKRGSRKYIKLILPLIIVSAMHLMVNKGVDKTDILVPLLTVIAGSLLIEQMSFKGDNIFATTIVVAQLAFGLQWLNLTPWLTNFGFGSGDLATSIQIASKFLVGDKVMNFLGFSFCIPLLVTAVITTKLLAVYMKRISDVEIRKEQEVELERMRLQAEETRILREMHSLVHDLKTPLMTVQGLSSLVEMATSEEKVRDYCRHIGNAVDKVNEMISEILYEKVRKPAEIEDLINYVRAHVMVKVEGRKVYFELDDNLPVLRINKIRVARAIDNLIQNAFRATSPTEGKIWIRVRSERQGVTFEVEDNGVGIPAEKLADIWTVGYSTRPEGSGLGLAFVKRVVESHQGTVEVESTVGKGTTVRIWLPEEVANDQNIGD